MSFSSIPLAFIAGLLSLLSPCILPFIPAVAASSMQTSKQGILILAAGISLSFALAGTVLTFILLSMNLSPDLMRTFSALLMLVMAGALLIPEMGDQLSFWLSRLTSKFPAIPEFDKGLGMQFLVGASLGLIWLPCVGPTLGTAIALASTGQSIPMAFIVMLAFGLGTALPLVAIGYASGQQLDKLKLSGKIGKQILGIALLVLALMIFTGLDKALERLALDILPDWVTSI